MARPAVPSKAFEEVVARCKQFLALVEGERHVEAAEHGIWLWNHMAAVSPVLVGVKHGVLADGLKRLAAAHPPTATTLRELRDATPIGSTDADGLAGVQDWVSLNTALGDDSKTIAWFDEIADTLPENEPLADVVRFRVVPVLVEHGRWRDVGRAYAHPMAAIRESIATRAEMNGESIPAEHQEQMRESATKGFREECALVVRGLRAADRSTEANEVAAAAIEVDPSPEMKAAVAEP